jgi:hypothetical protein
MLPAEETMMQNFLQPLLANGNIPELLQMSGPRLIVDDCMVRTSTTTTHVDEPIIMKIWPRMPLLMEW